MNRQTTGRRTRWIESGMMAAALACLSVAPSIASASTHDAWITTKTKMALLTTEGVSGTSVNVDTVNSTVTLHGKVESADEKAKAEAVARKIDGVTDVRNVLQVVSTPHAAVVQRTDDQIKTQLTKSLSAAPALEGISVQSVNNGVVLLGGTAKTLTAHLSAVEAAHRVPGVKRVVSEVKSPEALADSEIWRDWKKDSSDAASSVGNSARDAYVTSATKMRLLADKETPALAINVDTQDGVVTLFGIVPTKKAKMAAEADARKVSGVTKVQNELQIVPAAMQAMVKTHDADLERDVKKSLQDRAEFKDINVEVKNCVARLTGTVPDGMQRLEAAVVARSTQGVCSVNDELRISN